MQNQGSSISGRVGKGSDGWTQALLVAAFLGAPVAATAAPSADDLDQRIKVLERQLEIQKEEADAKAKDATSTTLNDKGVTFKKGDFELKLRGLVQADFRSFLDDSDTSVSSTAGGNAILSQSRGTSDGFLFRRIRPSLEANFGKLVSLRITPEFAGAGDAESASLIDAYVDLKFSPAATVRAGKVKGPVSLERLQSGAAIGFIERGFPSELAPNRDLGVQLQGDVLGSKLNYILGIYDGTPDGRNASTNGDNRFEYAARLFAEPFKDDQGALSGLGFGIAGSVGTKDQVITDTLGAETASNQGRADQFNNYAAQANPALPRYRSPGQNTVFNYQSAELGTPAPTGQNQVPEANSVLARTGVYANGDHVRIAPQAYWYWNSVGLLGEYITSEQEVGQNNVNAEFEHKAWQLAASYVITGEDASFRGVQKPANPFSIGGPGWGAFEVAARYGELDIDDDVFTTVAPNLNGVTGTTAFANPATAVREAKNWTVGVNWYLTSNAKVVLNYSQTAFDGGAPVEGGSAATVITARDRKDEKAVLARLQLSF